MASPINASICNLHYIFERCHFDMPDMYQCNVSTSFYNMSIKLKSLKGQNLQEDQPQLSQHNNILTNRVKCMLPNAHCK